MDLQAMSFINSWMKSPVRSYRKQYHNDLSFVKDKGECAADELGMTH